LNQIIGFGEMLLEDFPEAAPAEMRSSAEALLKTAHETVELLTELLPAGAETATPQNLDARQAASIRARLAPLVSRLVLNARRLNESAELEAPSFTGEIFTGEILQAASALAAFTEGGSLHGHSGGETRLPRGHAGQAHLLVIDDNAMNRQLLCSQLERLGYAVSTANNGAEGLAALRRQAFEVVLLDVQMPDMDGFETLAQLKADENLREIPVIMISASDEYQSVIRCIEGGAEDYLLKPFDPVLLRARLKASLEKKTLRDQQRQRTRELEAANEHLRAMQEQLITQEKLASLGNLAAGIAHEIKNPLNFIINFSNLSRELAEELQEALEARGWNKPEVAELLALLRSNLTKIEQHGKRADSIVRGMLQHARRPSGERDSTDLNALAAECVQLAYHGIKSADMTFNAAIEKNLDPAVGRVDIFPQDMSRVLINLATNAFHSVREKARHEGKVYRPTVKLTTRRAGECVEIHVRDNGTGIPAASRVKIFEPFYTTKPNGTGTGLGLSISQDIVTRQHKGELSVLSEEGQFAEFIVKLPELHRL
jgi:signal transduction histidine kinase